MATEESGMLHQCIEHLDYQDPSRTMGDLNEAAGKLLGLKSNRVQVTAASLGNKPADGAADGGADSSDHISWLVLNETISAELRSEYSLPGFISPEDGVAAGPEYFFIGQRPGHGREPHIDYSCENIWSAQIVGRKRWRLLPPDGGVLAAEVVAAGAAARDECGAVSTAGYEAVLEPGDILVWYPGWTHGTAAVDGASLALSKRKLSGIYNFCNPGAISHNECLELYKKHVDPDYTYVQRRPRIATKFEKKTTGRRLSWIRRASTPRDARRRPRHATPPQVHDGERPELCQAETDSRRHGAVRS